MDYWLLLKSTLCLLAPDRVAHRIRQIKLVMSWERFKKQNCLAKIMQERRVWYLGVSVVKGLWRLFV